MRKSSLAAMALTCLASPALAADPKGDWLVAEKTAVIRISPCAPAQPALCGNIVWTKGPAGTDQKNPDPAKRSRSIIGLTTLVNMKPTGRNKWEGEIYNALEGKTYEGNISLASDNVLRIEGCILGFLCGGQDWTRTKCDEPTGSVGGRPAPATPPAASATPASAPLSCRVAGP
jgi:uncharacterized protein (DUF2147 family)